MVFKNIVVLFHIIGKKFNHLAGNVLKDHGLLRRLWESYIFLHQLFFFYLSVYMYKLHIHGIKRTETIQEPQSNFQALYIN